MAQRRTSAVVGCLLMLALLVVPAIGCGSGGTDDGDGDPGVDPQNLAPFLGAIKGIATAGGARILICWSAATDDNDPASAITYNVYLSATSGGQNFATPTATSAAGATCIQLTSADSPLIAVGAEVFAVVRATDSGGATSACSAECSVTCVPTGSIAYVDPAAGGPGTLGNPADPFTTLQDAITAIPAAGGAVLAAGANYAELAASTAAGDPGSSIGIYGSFNAANFVAGATAATLLAGVDTDGNPSTLNGVGLTPVIPQVGHLDFRNTGRRSYLANFSFVDDEGDPLVGGVDVNIVVSCCSFNDSDPAAGGTPTDGLLFSESAPVQAQSVAVVGCFFDNISDCLEVVGGLTTLLLAGNRAEDCAQWLRGTTVTIPAGSAFRFHMDCNDITRITTSGFDLFATPEVDGGAGSVDIRLRENRFVGIQSNNEIERFGTHGAGSTLNFVVADNFIGPVDSDGLLVDLLPGNNTDTEVLAPTTTNLTVRENTFVLMNSEAFELDGMTPGMNGTINLLVEDCTFLQSDQESIEFDPSFPGVATFNQDFAALSVIVRDNTSSTSDGFIDAEMDLLRAGSSTLSVTDNLLDGMTDESCDINMQSFTTAVTAQGDDTASTSVTFNENTVQGTDESSLEVLELDMEVRGPARCEFVCNRIIFAGEESIFATFNFDGVSADPTLHFMCDNNTCKQADDDNVLDINFSGAGAGTVYARICNNEMRSGRDIVEFDNFSTADITGYVTFAHNFLSECTEGESVDFTFNEGTWSVLIARNLVLGGGDDTEEAFELGAGSTSEGADYLVRNNLVVSTGGGIEGDDAIHTLQLVNNTVAFGGTGNDANLGSTNGGVNSPVYVHNCVSFGHDFEDVGDETIATYSIFEDPPMAAGFGSILGDPIFTRQGTLVTPNQFFQLAPASPARNAGDPAPEFNDPDGSRNDMGAFGGPGAGPVGTLPSIKDPCPLYLVGFDPLLHLHAGANLIASGVTPIDVVFSADVDPATANAGNLAFTIGGVPVAGGYAAAGRRVTFTPAAPWPPGAQVRVTAGVGLQSTGGSALAFTDVRHFAVRPAGATAETEGNDTSGTANALPADAVQRVTGDLSADTDSDFFSFTGAAGERVQVSLFGDRLAASPADFDLRIYAGDGVTVLFENSTALQEGDPLVDFTLPVGGTCFIEVFDQFSGAGAGPFPYELEIWRR